MRVSHHSSNNAGYAPDGGLATTQGDISPGLKGSSYSFIYVLIFCTSVVAELGQGKST